MTATETDLAADLKDTLYTAVLSDVLDAAGYREQVMRAFVRPLSDGIRVFGRARTGLFEPRDTVADGEQPYALLIELLDDLETGSVPVFACDGPTETITPWGELLTTAAIARGAVGFVTDGLVRDVREIRSLDFPVFHGGIRPLDSAGRGKLVARDVAVTCGGVRVESGDIVYGDDDGVVVIPAAVADDILRAALEKIGGENTTRRELQAGRSLTEIYARYGVL